MTAYQQTVVHKAEPQQLDPVPENPWCLHCGADIKRVPGGHGTTWIHTDTQMVAARNGLDTIALDQLRDFWLSGGDTSRPRHEWGEDVELSGSDLVDFVGELLHFTGRLSP